MSEYIVTNDEAIDKMKDTVPCPPDRWGEPYERVTEYRDGLEEWNSGEATCELKEEIVRCRDCKYALADNWSDTPECAWCDENQREINHDGFCAWGERK